MKFQLQPVQGHQSTFQPGEQGIRWLGLEALRLDRDEDWRGSFVDQEAALVILGGRCTVAITPPGGEKVEWRGLGSRGDVFSGLPTSVYAPRGSEIAIKAESKVEIAIGKAPASIDL